VNYGDKTLSILDLRTRTEIATLPVGLHPQELAVDSKSNRIYVANVQGNSVTVLTVPGMPSSVFATRAATPTP